MIGELIGIGIMAAISYVPFLQNIFKTAPLTLADWGFLVVAAVTLFFAEEARKWVMRRRDARSVAALDHFYREGDSLMKVIIVGCGRVGAYTAASSGPAGSRGGRDRQGPAGVPAAAPRLRRPHHQGVRVRP